MTDRATYVGAPQLFLLDQACLALHRAFGTPPYLVGSSLERRDFRDVDVRVILDDAEFARLFGGEGFPKAFPAATNGRHNALWSLMCTAISLQLSQATGLPIDFQIQAQTEANAQYPGKRSALGIFPYSPEEIDEQAPRVGTEQTQ